MLGVGLVVPGMPVPPMLEPEGVPEEDPPPVELPLVPDPELFSFASPELPPVVPAHALSSTAQAMGIIHLVINYSRKDKKAVRITTTYRKTA